VPGFSTFIASAGWENDANIVLEHGKRLPSGIPKAYAMAH